MGHVFVVHGDLLKISADALLIPCDRFGHVNVHWHPYGPARDRSALIEEMQRSRVSSRRVGDGTAVRYVDSGATTKSADPEWLRTGVSAGLAAAIEDVSGSLGGDRRARPLVAMPVFGVGDGGFDGVRGEALKVQLEAAAEAVTGAAVDVVMVCFDRSDFAALQLQRDDESWRDLSTSLRSAGDDLTAAVQAGRLVLFLGAGVSVAAGIGDFSSLVEDLERLHDGVSDDARTLPERVQRLKNAKGEEWINREVAELVRRDRYSLTHGLLASLRVREAITTNFDDLYEQACVRPFADIAVDSGGPVEVLPWERSAVSRPWLLKAHGDPMRSGDLVLTAESFAAFETDRPSVAGVVRAMFALSREVFFVGYSLTDENIKKLVDEAAGFHQSFGVAHPRLGTIVGLESTAVRSSENPVRLGLKDATDESLGAAARRLQILLDYIAWKASRDEAAWLLDHRYRALLAGDTERRRAQALADGALPTAAPWPTLGASLRRFGRR